jgi:hypothetical protein
MSNVPKHTDNQPGEFVDDPENEPGSQQPPPAAPDDVPPDEQSDG